MLSKIKKLFRPDTARETHTQDGEHFRKLGNRHADEGNLALADEAYRRAIALDPRDAHAHANLGLVLVDTKRNSEAATVLKTALALDPTLALAHYLLGRMEEDSANWAEAARHFLRALEHKLDLRALSRSLTNALMQCGRVDEARSVLQQGLRATPEVADYYLGLGMLAAHENQFDEAAVCFRQAAVCEPQSAEIQFHLAKACHQAGKLDDALASFSQAAALDPGFALAHNGMGVLYNEQEKYGDAIVCFQKALRLAPTDAMVLKNLGVVHTAEGNLHEALAHYEQFIAQGPDSTQAGVARWTIAVNRMRLFAEQIADPGELTARCIAELDALEQWCDAHEIDAAIVVGAMPLFFLAYREVNWRDVLVRHGRLCSRLMADWHAKQSFTPGAPRPRNGKIRLGIVGAELSSHSVWIAFVKGWVERFDRTRFEIQTYFLGGQADHETRHAASLSDVFCDMSGQSTFDTVQAINQHAPDILLYPAIGIDRASLKLASMRLAPVQVAAWGHPESSGFPTMDYYLSAEDFEPAYAQECYAERLIRLPHLACAYTPLGVQEVETDFKSLGIDLANPVLLCPGMSVKYTPEHDAVFIEIARRLGRCQFVFFNSRPLGHAEKLKKRLEQVFATAGMALSEYCVFIPWQPRPVFYALMRRAHVFLDTIGFSGFNTAIQAAECGIPVVAFDGKFMRGRLAAGILRRAGLTELIAETDQAFINLAVKLASDEAYRKTMREKMAAGAPALFNDPVPAAALNDFLASCRPLNASTEASS